MYTCEVFSITLYRCPSIQESHLRLVIVSPDACAVCTRVCTWDTRLCVQLYLHLIIPFEINSKLCFTKALEKEHTSIRLFYWPMQHTYTSLSRQCLRPDRKSHQWLLEPQWSVHSAIYPCIPLFLLVPTIWNSGYWCLTRRHFESI